ncbi:Kinetochore protein [Dirofilaria immitis]
MDEYCNSHVYSALFRHFYTSSIVSDTVFGCLRMLYKGLVTRSKSEFLYVWSKNFATEVLLDKKLVPVSERIPSLGDWLVFNIKADSNFIDDFIEIPDLLPTKVNEHGDIMVKTRISFRSNDVSDCNLLAHSNDLGIIGIFRNFPNLNESYDYDVWVERIPLARSDLERLYKTSWYIGGEFPEQVVKTSLERFSSVHSLSSRFNRSVRLPNSIFENNYFNVTMHTVRNSFSSDDLDFDELQEYSGLRERSLSSQSYFTEQQFLDSQPCTSMEEVEKEENKENETVVGLVTSSFNGKAFVWSSILGKGMISLYFGEQIRRGEWIKFIPCPMNDICLQEHDESRQCKYTAENWCVVNPIYPTRSYRTIISVQVKLFIPQCYQYGRCLLVWIMEMKSDGSSNKWVVHKVSQLLENGESVPKLKSVSFAADALRYMNEDSLIHNAMKKVDWNLTEQLREPHLLSDNILKHRI